MRTIWIIPGMFGLNVGFTFGSTKSGNSFSLKSVFGKAWTIVDAAVARSAQRRHLQSLPDYMLKDLGLSQEAVAFECRKPFWR